MEADPTESMDACNHSATDLITSNQTAYSQVSNIDLQPIKQAIKLEVAVTDDNLEWTPTGHANNEFRDH